MAIIVTGATGNFGRQVTDILLQEVAPKDLILLTRRPERLADLAAEGVQVRKGDFDDPASLPAAFEGGERMLLISTARVGSRVGQHGAAIDAAKQVGVKHIAYTSFVGVHDDNPAIVTVDHRATEDLMRASGLAWTALRDSQYAEAAAGVPVEVLAHAHRRVDRARIEAVIAPPWAVRCAGRLMCGRRRCGRDYG